MVKTGKLEKCLHRLRLDNDTESFELYKIKCKDCNGENNSCILYSVRPGIRISNLITDCSIYISMWLSKLYE